MKSRKNNRTYQYGVLTNEIHTGTFEDLSVKNGRFLIVKLCLNTCLFIMQLWKQT